MAVTLNKERPALRKLDYEVIIQSGRHHGANAWCVQNFGPRWSPVDNRQGRWATFWGGVDMFSHYRFCFATEQDAMLFTLRWL